VVRYGRSRSFKVIKIATNRKPVSYFLLVFYCNYMPIFHSFPDYNDLLVENLRFLPFLPRDAYGPMPWWGVCLSVRPSVRPTRSCIVSKWANIFNFFSTSGKSAILVLATYNFMVIFERRPQLRGRQMQEGYKNAIFDCDQYLAFVSEITQDRFHS